MVCSCVSTSGLVQAYPLIHAVVVEDFEDESDVCCSRYGDPIELLPDMLERTCCDLWHVCCPEKVYMRTERGDTVVMLYLIPDNHEALAECCPWVRLGCMCC